MLECSNCKAQYRTPQHMGRHMVQCRRRERYFRQERAQDTVQAEEEVNIEHGTEGMNIINCEIVTVNPAMGDGCGVLGAEEPEAMEELAVGSGRCGDLAEFVSRFYRAYSDTTETLWPSEVNRRDFGSRGEALVNFCIKRRFNSSAIRDVYEFQKELELQTGKVPYPGKQLHWVNEDFFNSDALISAVTEKRRVVVRQECWREAKIRTMVGSVDTGVFRPLRQFIISEIEKAGGLANIVTPAPIFDDNGDRLYSGLMDSEAMIQDYNSLKDTQNDAIPVYFSLYGDKTMLARSGAQDGMILRCRVDNLKDGSTDNWIDVAYAPVLSYGPEHNAQTVRDARLNLFHRFLYLMFQDIVSPGCYESGSEEQSRGHTEQYTHIRPRLLSLVADHPQERDVLSLKRGMSFKDCSQCEFQSMEERTLNKRRRLDVGSSTCEGPSQEHGQDITNFKVGTDEYTVRNVQHIVTLQCRVTLRDCISRDAHGLRTDTLRNLLLGMDRAQCHGMGVSVAEMKKVLSTNSALRLPSAICVLPEITTQPFRLFKLCGIDLLHVFDIGISRMLCDDAFKLFMNPRHYAQRTKAELVRTANRRIGSLPPESCVQSYVHFKNMEADRQASFTGKHRKELLPFLWYAVVGLRTDVPPDEDEFYCTCLGLDRLQTGLRLRNCGDGRGRRTQMEIIKLQSEAEETSDKIQACFESDESTKLHRLRVHLKDHLIRFGSMAAHDTACNECLHKSVKASYQATNKRLREIPRQILQVNVSAEAFKKNTLNETPTTEHSHLSGAAVQNGNEGSQYLEMSISIEANRAIQSLIASATETASYKMDTVVSHLLGTRDNYGINCYRKRSSTSVSPTFECLEGRSTAKKQVIYAGSDFKYCKCRNDGVLYTSSVGEQYGIIEAIIEKNNSLGASEGGTRVFIVRRMERIDGEDGNCRIVTEFGFIRLKYCLFHGEVLVEAVNQERILRKTIIVENMYKFTKRHSFATLPSEIDERAEERKARRFFVVRNTDLSVL